MITKWDSKGVFFVIRHKENLKYKTLQKREIPPKGAQSILKDEEIVLSNPLSRDNYPKKLRRVEIRENEKKQTIEMISNN